MAPLPSDVVTSLRRSRVRRRALAALARLGRAYPAQLARESGLALRQVRLALRGTPPEYREPLSLARVGLARPARFVGGRFEYEITPLGSRAADLVRDDAVGGDDDGPAPAPQAAAEDADAFRRARPAPAPGVGRDRGPGLGP